MAPQRPALWHPLETLLAQVRHENLASLAVGARGGCILRPVVDFLKIKYVERIVWRIEQQIDCYRLFQHHVEKILVEWPYIYIDVSMFFGHLLEASGIFSLFLAYVGAGGLGISNADLRTKKLPPGEAAERSCYESARYGKGLCLHGMKQQQCWDLYIMRIIHDNIVRYSGI